MTYVAEQTSAELRAHMEWLTSKYGWYEPLADRLWKEVQALDLALSTLKPEGEAANG